MKGKKMLNDFGTVAGCGILLEVIKGLVHITTHWSSYSDDNNESSEDDTQDIKNDDTQD